MKFDPDCVRDVLIAAEERTDGDSMVWIIPGRYESNIVPGLSAYPYDVAVYHIRQCEQSGLIKTTKPFIDGSQDVRDLTPQGHQLLAKLRLPPVIQAWSKAKEAGLLSSVDSVVQWVLGIAGMLRK